MTALIGLAVLLILVALGKGWVKLDPKTLLPTMHKVGGIIALGVAAILAMRGRFDMALALGGLGTWLLDIDWRRYLPMGRAGAGGAAPGRVSKVRSRLIEMTLDHDTGVMSGMILAGPDAGRPFETMSEQELGTLAQACAAEDQDGLRLLEAYLDRRFPGWRETADPNVHARSGQGHSGEQGGRSRGTITEQEAYEILGLQPGASEDDIRQSHRSLMKKFHPDQGGTTWLATRLNEARDVLLGSHRSRS
jgi:hypothetical protein